MARRGIEVTTWLDGTKYELCVCVSLGVWKTAILFTDKIHSNGNDG